MRNDAVLAPEAPALARYAYKASLIGASHQFELTEQGLSWRIGSRRGIWRYGDIAAIRLSFRPVSMQARRFRADISHDDGGRIAILSTSWQTAALMAPQDTAYRDFIVRLHARMAEAGSRALLSGGLGPTAYSAGLVFLALVALAMAGLLVRSLLTGEFAGSLFIAGFAGLFAWQVGGFMRRNQPRTYGFDHLPDALLP
jgi:hypothetical protein